MFLLPPLAGDVLDKSIRLEDTVIRESIEDGVAVTPAGHETRPAEHSEMLAHVGDLAADPGAEVADRELTDGERLEDAQALGIREGSTDGGVALAIGLGGDWQVIQHCLRRYQCLRKHASSGRAQTGHKPG